MRAAAREKRHTGGTREKRGRDREKEEEKDDESTRACVRAL